MKKYLAEFLGTLALASAVLLSISVPFIIDTPIVAGLVLMLFVYTVGPISGAHLNPAITIGLWTVGKIKLKEAIFYIAAQFIAGALVYFLAKEWGHMETAQVIKLSWDILLAESIGTFLLSFGVSSIVYEKVSGIMSGIVIGGSLFLGIAFAASLGSSGILNPAVALGLHSFNLMYILGPILGSIIGMSTYKMLIGETAHEKNHPKRKN